MAVVAVALGWQAILVAVTLGISLIVMGFDWVGPDLVFGLLTTIYTVAGILDLKAASAGFANTGVLTVVMLYLVAEGVYQTGGLEIAMNAVLGKTYTVFWAQVRMMIPVMFVSAFLNNTPICALMIPILLAWGRRCGISPKKLLLPMSFATVLGGTSTLIGTSTNLVVSGLQQEKYGSKNPELVFSFFDITPYGVPYAIWGFAYIVLFSRWLLPGDDAADDLTSGLLVPASSRAAGATAKKSGLSGGKVAIAALSRGGVAPAEPYHSETVIGANDVVYVTGSVHAVEQVARDFGLVLLTSDNDGADGAAVKDPDAALLAAAANSAEEGFGLAAADGATSLLQVQVLKGADFVGKTVRDVGFRSRFNAAVIAIKRAGRREAGRLGDVALQPRDVLVLSVGAGFDPTADDFRRAFTGLLYLDEALARQFTTALTVTKRSKEAGKSIAEVGLRGINGLYLFQIDRADGTQLKAVGHDTVLQVGDTLWFAGDLDGLSYLSKYTSLAHLQQAQVEKLSADIIHRRLVQVVVSPHGPLDGARLREARFRQTFGAAVLGVHRAGKPMAGDISALPLKAGDVLVVEAGPEFLSSFANHRAFSLISEVPNSSPMKRSKMLIALALTFVMVATQIIGGAMNKEFVHLWPMAMLTAGAMLACKCLSAEQARKSIDWEVYLCIAFAFAVSSAMEKTKLALAIAQVFVALATAIGGQTAALACIYLVTALLSELLTNNAAAAIMYPIASSAADQLGIHPNLMSVAVMLGGSAGWILPYSYQCNLMVYAAGKYRTRDFVKIGVPYHPWLFVGVIVILGAGDRWAIPLIAALAFTAVVIVVPAVYEFVLNERQKQKVDAQIERLKSSASRSFGRLKSSKSLRGGGSSKSLAANGGGL